MAYLSAGDIVAAGATQAQADMATSIVNAALGRPEGLEWVQGADGGPCYMAQATPNGRLVLTTGLAPGVNVAATVQGFVTQDTVGEVYIADRTTGGSTEALVVSAVSGQVVTFARVGLAHAIGATLEAGLVITEERTLPAKRSVTLLARPPIVRLMSGLGRYSYGRRSQQRYGQEDFGLISSLQQFAGTPVWQSFDVAEATVSPRGELFTPAGVYLSYFTDVRVRYVAGWPVDGVPAPIRQACLSVLASMATFPELSGNTKRLTAGGTTIERFADSVLDADTKNLLAPFMANRLV